MKALRLIPRRIYAGFGLATLAAFVLGTALLSSSAADAKPDKEAKTEKKKTEKKAEKKPVLNGAELYAIHCNRCHPERYATERTPSQWKTIMMHMRVRANLPADQAKAIMKYLQTDSGTP